MSSDLLNEFGKLEDNPWQVSGSQGTGTIGTIEDDFGDFEDPVDEIRQTAESPVSDSGDKCQPGPFGSRTSHDHSAASLQVGDVNDNWGSFERGTTLFDADEHMAADKSRIPKEDVKKKLRKELPPAPPIEFDDDLDAWEPQDVTPHQTVQEALIPQSPTPIIVKANEAQAQAWATKPANVEAPPSNVPPPSILLSLSSIILRSIASSLRTTVSDQDSLEVDILQNSLSTLRALARIIAGRKLRWRRDTLLSQSMKIGQAGKQGGMKLTGVDKTESRREDQEAAEVIRIWKEHVGSLRSAVAMHSGHRSLSGLVVPDIAETMPIRLAKLREGAVTAPKACFLCGMKRDERVLRVDVDVEDSFGEYWVDHWGHIDCVDFWTEQKSHLAQR